MTTLYIRDVPESVANTLKQRAAAQGQSLSTYVTAQLARIAARPSNEEIVARLRGRERDATVTTERVIAELAAARR